MLGAVAVLGVVDGEVISTFGDVAAESGATGLRETAGAGAGAAAAGVGAGVGFTATGATTGGVGGTTTAAGAACIKGSEAKTKGVKGEGSTCGCGCGVCAGGVTGTRGLFSLVLGVLLALFAATGGREVGTITFAGAP